MEKKKENILTLLIFLMVFLISGYFQWSFWPGNWDVGIRIITLFIALFAIAVYRVTIWDINKVVKKSPGPVKKQIVQNIGHLASMEEKRQNESNDYQVTYDQMMSNITIQNKEYERKIRNEKILMLKSENMTNASIADEVNISAMQVGRILKEMGVT